MKYSILMNIYNNILHIFKERKVAAVSFAYDHFFMSVDGKTYKVSIEEVEE